MCLVVLAVLSVALGGKTQCTKPFDGSDRPLHKLTWLSIGKSKSFLASVPPLCVYMSLHDCNPHHPFVGANTSLLRAPGSGHCGMVRRLSEAR